MFVTIDILSACIAVVFFCDVEEDLSSRWSKISRLISFLLDTIHCVLNIIPNQIKIALFEEQKKIHHGTSVRCSSFCLADRIIYWFRFDFGGHLNVIKTDRLIREGISFGKRLIGHSNTQKNNKIFHVKSGLKETGDICLPFR